MPYSNNETKSYYFIAIPDLFIPSETIIKDLKKIIEDDNFPAKFKNYSITLKSLNLYTYSISANRRFIPKVNAPYITWLLFMLFQTFYQALNTLSQ